MRHDQKLNKPIFYVLFKPSGSTHQGEVDHVILPRVYRVPNETKHCIEPQGMAPIVLVCVVIAYVVGIAISIGIVVKCIFHRRNEKTAPAACAKGTPILTLQVTALYQEEMATETDQGPPDTTVKRSEASVEVLPSAIC